MARNNQNAPVEESTEAGTEVSQALTRQQNVFGVKYTLSGIPATVEDYDKLSNRPGACLETAIGHDIAHKFNAQARSAIIDQLVKAVKEQNAEAVIPDQADTETDTAYFKRLLEEGVVTKEQVEALAITIEYSGAGQRSGVARKYKDIAEAAIKKAGSAEAAAAAVQVKLNKLEIPFTVAATVDSIAEAAKLISES